MTRLLAALATAVAVTTLASPADAATKTMKGSYDVSLPVPFPVNEDIPGYHGCWNGEENVSKHTRAIKLPAVGSFKAEVRFLGDWDLYLFDTKGTMLAASESSDVATEAEGIEKLLWKRGKKGQTINLVACNWVGPKDAKVSYTHTYTTK